MKKIGIFTAFVALALFVVPAFASTVQFSLGNDDNSRSITDGRANFAIVDTNNPASNNGEITKFNYYASTSNPFRFFVVDTTNVVKWVSDEIFPDEIGQNEYPLDNPVYVKTGWNVGLYFASTGTIPFDRPGTAAWYTHGGYGVPVVGSTMTYDSSDTRTYSFVATATLLPYGVILTPSEGDELYGSVLLTAEYFDGDNIKDDIVQWAVRKGTCDAATGTVFGNVDGHSDTYTWDGSNFSTTLDFSSEDLGDYCFVFNPKDDSGEVDVRETRLFKIILNPDLDGDGVLNDEDCDPNDPEITLTANSKACILYTSGVPGEGILTAPGLTKEFNENSKAAEHAGKKK
jgi:hypothetical protein